MWTTLYDERRDACEKLRLRGYVNIVEMTKIFGRCNEMAAALGMHTDGGSSVAKWLRMQTSPTAASEQRAAIWVAKNLAEQAGEPAKPAVLFDVDAKLAEILVDNVAELPAEPVQPMLLVVCPTSGAERIQRVLGLLGCEVVAV